MAGPRTRGMALLALLCFWCACGQITFSRDWTGGKRGHAPLEVAQRSTNNCHRYNRICRHFIHELKAALSAQNGRRRWPDTDDIYYDEK